MSFIPRYHHTFPIINPQTGESAREICSFHSRPFTRGSCRRVHKGQLLLTISQSEKVVVKVNVDKTINSERECQLEVNRFLEFERVLDRLKGMDVDKKYIYDIAVLSTSYAQVEKVSGSIIMGCCSDRKVREGEYVIIQPRLVAGFQDFLDPYDIEISRTRTLFHAIAHASFVLSCGRYVISGMKGGILQRADSSGQINYCLASLTINSKEEEFGKKDKGEAEMRRFLKNHSCSCLCDALSSRLHSPTHSSSVSVGCTVSQTLCDARNLTPTAPKEENVLGSKNASDPISEANTCLTETNLNFDQTWPSQTKELPPSYNERNSDQGNFPMIIFRDGLPPYS